jgi:hypothetical protein
MDDFAAADFSPVAWLNAHLNPDAAESIEDQVNQQLARLQIRSREISQTADQHIRILVSDLPQSMAKLSQIASTVSEISDSVRGLTNSGYKFKSGNVPDQITELNSLKVRRDRLKEASEALKHGIEFEADLADLKALAPSESFEVVCGRYEKISASARVLAGIPRFQASQGELQAVYQIIENRLKTELTTACSPTNAENFVKFAGLAKRISAPHLPGMVVLAQFRDSITEVISRFTDGPLGLTKWINPCFEQCRERALDLTNWTHRLKPQLFDTGLRNDMLAIMSQLLGAAIEPKAQRLLASTDFTSLSQVMRDISAFADRLSVDLTISTGTFLRGCVDSVQAAFPGVLQSYLSAFLQPPPKPSAKSPVRSPARQSPDPVPPFDGAKLGRLVLTGIGCLPSIRVLSRDHPRCISHVCTFLTGAIQLTISERASSKPKPDETSFEVALVDRIRYYTSQLENGRRIEQFEADATALCASPLPVMPSGAIAGLLAAVEAEIIEVMVARPIGILSGVSAAKDWIAEIEDEEAAVFEGTSRYVATVSSLMIGLMRQLGTNDGLANDLVARWMIRAAVAVLAACLGEFRKIEALSRHGRRQLLADVCELQNLFANWIPESKAALGEIIRQLEAEIEARPAAEDVGALRARIDEALVVVGRVRP